MPYIVRVLREKREREALRPALLPYVARNYHMLRKASLVWLRPFDGQMKYQRPSPRWNVVYRFLSASAFSLKTHISVNRSRFAIGDIFPRDFLFRENSLIISRDENLFAERISVFFFSGHPAACGRDKWIQLHRREGFLLPLSMPIQKGIDTDIKFRGEWPTLARITVRVISVIYSGREMHTRSIYSGSLIDNAIERARRYSVRRARDALNPSSCVLCYQILYFCTIIVTHEKISKMDFKNFCHIRDLIRT